MKLAPGALLLYKNKCASLTAVNGDKIEIRVAGADSRSVRPKDVRLLHPGPVSALPPPEPEHRTDTQELLELMEQERFSFADFCELAFGSFTPGSAFAAWQLLEEEVYFTGDPETGVTARSPEEIAAKLAARDAKNNAKLARQQLIERLKAHTYLESDRNHLTEIEAVALGRAPSSALMHDLGIEATPEKAHAFLLALNFWTPLRNPYPERFDAERTAPALELAAPPAEERRDLRSMRALAIDDEGSNDPDDAIGFDGGLLRVHVADPASVITPGSPADDEAASRGSSCYWPTGMVPMLPAAATPLFGLGLAAESPALSLGIEIDGDGRAHLHEITRSTIRVERCTYAQCEAIMQEKPLPEITEALERFKAARHEAGALFIRLPEVKWRVDDAGVVSFSPCPVTPERELVANAMLAAGAALGEYGTLHDWPLLHVVQAPPDIEIPADVGEDPVAMMALRKNSKPGVVTPLDGNHYGLGLANYCRFTSPLRRYSDLLLHQQIRRLLAGETPLDFDYLDRRLTLSEEASTRRRKLERYVNEHYLMVYLMQNPDYCGDAIVVDKDGDRVSLLIGELAYEYKCRFPGRLTLGESVRVGNPRVDLAELKVRFEIEKNRA